MLQVQDGAINEVATTLTVTTGGYVPTTTFVAGQLTTGYITYEPYTYWGSYPVYITTDKTKKAIDVLKALQAEKLLKCDSVTRFIELVEKISALL